ncbi:MAG: hypothetical protein ACLR9E_02850, partial [Bifidobacterium longum]
RHAPDQGLDVGFARYSQTDTGNTVPLIGELTVTCLPDVSSGEVFAMDFPVDDGVSCLVTNAMKIKKPRRTEAFDGSCDWA